MSAREYLLTLSAVPAKPLKGSSHARQAFPFKLTFKQGRDWWHAIPDNHKDKVASKTRGKGNFHWIRFVSPEVFARIQQENIDKVAKK
jgi:hypothetical protein